MKEYLIKNLKKRYIILNNILYILLILFIKKKDRNLRFYIDYRKLNIITKRDRYLILLINEVLTRVVGSKYLIRLDIITAFNKLKIDPASEDLIIFIILFSVFKYLVISFSLTNRSAIFQYYINDVL